MSPPARGPYQSRLFNFINRQSRRLVDKSIRALRHLKVAAVWGIEILLYPFYLLVQTSLSAGNQLSRAARAIFPRLKEAFSPSQHPKKLLAADTAIVRVLERLKVVEPAAATERTGSQEWKAQDYIVIDSEPEKLQASTPTEQAWVIQGLANLLTEQTLAIVVVPNKIVDILTPQQQQKLSAKISWELADLMRQRHLKCSPAVKKAPRRFSTLDQPPIFLPMRLFWRVMAWEQTSRVAIAVNLFGESTLVHVTTGINQADPTQPHFSIISFNGKVAELVSKHLVPDSRLGIVGSKSSNHQLVNSIKKRLRKLKNSSLSSNFSTISPQAYQTNTFAIQALIYAAIDYFFGRSRKHRLRSRTQSQSSVKVKGHSPQAVLSPSQKTDADVAAPWLGKRDLFDSPKAKVSTKNHYSQIKNHKSQALLPEAFQGNPPPMPGTSPQEFVKASLSRKQHQGKLAAPIKNKAKVEYPESVVETHPQVNTQNRQKDTVTTTTGITSSAVLQALDQSTMPVVEGTGSSIATASDSSPDTYTKSRQNWIETDATPTGYVKHPLEHLLGWLDFAMLWIEERVVKFWQWIRRLWFRG
ncbi:MAG: hypothetical protein F6K58_02805 [Symploca sp. SIO2E9]|nr:hypothetical protein [Symploca sp. SIO2E9]